MNACFLCLPWSAFTTVQLEALLKGILQGSAKVPVRIQTAPRVGGINDVGAWTGVGANGEPKSTNCMRKFHGGDHLKNHNAIKPIETSCETGLKDSSSLLFCTLQEPNAESSSFALSLRALEQAIVKCGMEPVFHIVLDDGSTLNMFEEAGRVTSPIIEKWLKDLTKDGVVSSSRTLPVCSYDIINLRWSGTAVLNSCTDLLREEITGIVPEEQRTGPLLLCKIMQHVYRPSISRISKLKNELGSLSINKFPAENVSAYVTKAVAIIREIKLNLLDDRPIPELTTIALKGFNTSTDPYFQSKARDYSIASDVNGFDSTLGNKQLDAIATLNELDDLYRILHNQGNYGPALQISKTGRPAAFQAQTKDTPQYGALQQDRSASKTNHSNGGSKPFSKEPPRHGLDDATNVKVIELIKAKLPTLPPREHIKDSDEYTISVSGKILAKYCRHCGRFSKGASAHFTTEHQGTRRFPYKSPGSDASGAPAPAPAPVPAPATSDTPTAGGYLGALQPPLNVPTVDSSTLFHTPVSYDFGTMASIDPSDLDLSDSDTQALLSFLGGTSS